MYITWFNGQVVTAISWTYDSDVYIESSVDKPVNQKYFFKHSTDALVHSKKVRSFTFNSKMIQIIQYMPRFVCSEAGALS